MLEDHQRCARITFVQSRLPEDPSGIISPADVQQPCFALWGRPNHGSSGYLTRQRSVSATLCFIPFCLVMLLGSPAISQSATDDRLAPQDAEIRISGWRASFGGVAEAAPLHDVFMIGTDGALEILDLRHLPAAGSTCGGTGEADSRPPASQKSGKSCPGCPASDAGTRRAVIAQTCRGAPARGTTARGRALGD